MKSSGTGVASASKQPFPHADAKPFVKRVYEAFGADRMIWRESGASMEEFDRAVQLFDSMFDFAPDPERAKIRGLTSQRLFAFPETRNGQGQTIVRSRYGFSSEVSGSDDGGRDAAGAIGRKSAGDFEPKGCTVDARNRDARRRGRAAARRSADRRHRVIRALSRGARLCAALAQRQ